MRKAPKAHTITDQIDYRLLDRMKSEHNYKLKHTDSIKLIEIYNSKQSWVIPLNVTTMNNNIVIVFIKKSRIYNHCLFFITWFKWNVRVIKMLWSK